MHGYPTISLSAVFGGAWRCVFLRCQALLLVKCGRIIAIVGADLGRYATACQHYTQNYGKNASFLNSANSGKPKQWSFGAKLHCLRHSVVSEGASVRTESDSVVSERLSELLGQLSES